MVADEQRRGLRKPLEGLRILDLSRVLTGPFCSMILGDLGAEILKVEEIDKGDPARAVSPFIEGVSHYFLAVNRNKKSISVDTRTAQGRQIVLDLARHSDVLLENFRPGVMDRLGLSVAALREVNPRLVICSISGFGQDGHLSGKPSFDLIAQAMSGVMSVNGEPGIDPVRLGLPLGDLGAGLWAAIGVLAALQHRGNTGEALEVDVSLLDGLISLLTYMAEIYFFTGESPKQIGNSHYSVVPYGRFPVKDGHIVLALHIGSFWRKFCTAIGRPEWAADPRFRRAADRTANRNELEREMAAVLTTRPSAEWIALFEAQDIPCAAVLDIGEALSQEVVRERRMIKECLHPVAGPLKVLGSPYRFGRAFDDLPPTPPPELGEHTTQVLSELLGYDSELIDRLARDKVIGG